MAEKRKITPLTIEFKRKVIKSVEENPAKKKTDIAKEFNIPSTTLHTILKNKEKYEESRGLGKTCVRAKKSEFNDVEECVVKWLKQCRDKNLPISGPVLQDKAQDFAKNLGHEHFRASNGWLQNFKKRNQIVFKKICGESASVDNSVCVDWIAQIQDQVAGYQPEDVYNADETGLFYKCLPDKTLSFKGDSCHGGKHSKERITVLLCVNSTGSDKLRPLVIGKAQHPRCFKYVESFPTDYIANKKSWMNGDAFGVWLKDVDKLMKKKKRQILIFIDNCAAHRDIPKLTNVKIKFLPPNTTSKLQPLDQGIIKNFKVFYRKELVRLFLNNLDESTPLKINVLDAMWMLSKAWNNITAETIAHCFKKSGFNTSEEPNHPLQPVQDEPVIAPSSWVEVTRSLNIQGMEFEEYVNFDDEVAVCGEVTETDILDSVLPSHMQEEQTEEDEEDDSIDRPAPTSKDARNAIGVLKCFFEKKGDSISDSVVKSINELDSALDYINVSNLTKQTKINEFFSNMPCTSSNCEVDQN